MSKCRPDCCSPGKGSDDGLMIIGFIALVAIVYGIIRAILHVLVVVLHYLIIIAEITCITAASVAVLILAVIITARIIHRHRKLNPQIVGYTTDSAFVPILRIGQSGEPADAGQLFAEAVANDMNPQFINEILGTAFEEPQE